MHYSGSPLAVDFGEEANQPSVSIVDVTATTSAKVSYRTVDAAVPLRTLRDSLDELASMLVEPDAWLRVYVREQPRAGLREEVQELLPRALEVRIDPTSLPELPQPVAQQRASRSPTELFAEYLGAKGIADAAVGTLFNELHDELVSEGVAR